MRRLWRYRIELSPLAQILTQRMVETSTGFVTNEMALSLCLWPSNHFHNNYKKEFHIQLYQIKGISLVLMSADFLNSFPSAFLAGIAFFVSLSSVRLPY
jgi:hypothetical protein